MFNYTEQGFSEPILCLIKELEEYLINKKTEEGKIDFNFNIWLDDTINIFKDKLLGMSEREIFMYVLGLAAGVGLDLSSKETEYY